MELQSITLPISEVPIKLVKTKIVDENDTISEDTVGHIVLLADVGTGTTLELPFPVIHKFKVPVAAWTKHKVTGEYTVPAPNPFTKPVYSVLVRGEIALESAVAEHKKLLAEIAALSVSEDTKIVIKHDYLGLDVVSEIEEEVLAGLPLLKEAEIKR